MPSAWKWLMLLRVTVVEASILSATGNVVTVMSTWMSPPVQSRHSTKMFSVVPTRSRLGAINTSLWTECQERRQAPPSQSIWSCVSIARGIVQNPNGNAYISENLSNIAQKFLCSHVVVFQTYRSGHIPQKWNGNAFFAFGLHRDIWGHMITGRSQDEILLDLHLARWDFTRVTACALQTAECRQEHAGRRPVLVSDWLEN